MKTAFTGKSLQFLNKDIPAGAVYATGKLNYGSADLERSANELSNYGGGSAGYIGLDDDFLSFSGDTGSFADPLHKGKLYTITLTNSAGSARNALLCPGLIRDAVGLIDDGAFNDTTGAAGLSGAGGPMAIVYLNAFIDKFPSIVAGFKVSTSNINQFEQQITIQKQSPFKQHTSRIINVAAYASEANPNTTLISVQESFYMDSQTVIAYPVLPATTVSIQLFFGASLNIARALRSKAERGLKNLAASGVLPGAVMASYRGRR